MMDISRRTAMRDALFGAVGLGSAMGALASPASASPLPLLAPEPVPGVQLRKARLNGIDISYAIAGRGPALLLLHGWPFTWYSWRKIIPELAKVRTVIAPDLRGMGATEKPSSGYDVQTLSQDAAALIAHEGFDRADVLGHDLGVGVAFMLASRFPGLVRRLALTESIVLGAPHAELFMKDPPWWVAFHNVRGLSEHVVAGKEDLYLDWFYTNLTHQRRGISRQTRDQHVAAYRGAEALRGGFEHYRAFPLTTAQGEEASKTRLGMPVLALGGELIGDVLYRQMAAIADSVQGGTIENCGHVMQEERPDELISRLRAFL